MKKVINVILIILIVSALIWFLTDLAGYYTVTRIKTSVDSVQVVDTVTNLKSWNSHTAKPDFDWSSLFGFFSGIILYFLKYFFYDKENLKKKRKSY